MVNTFDYLNIQFQHFSLLYSVPTNVLMNGNKIIFSIYISNTESNLQSICQHEALTRPRMCVYLLRVSVLLKFIQTFLEDVEPVDQRKTLDLSLHC